MLILNLLSYNNFKVCPRLPNFAYITSESCTDYCQSANYGDGLVIGTAPFCAGKCDQDCPNSSWVDYGNGCWSGNKICCCGKPNEFGCYIIAYLNTVLKVCTYWEIKQSLYIHI